MTKLHVLRPGIPTGPLTRGECREWQFQCALTGCRFNLRNEESREHIPGCEPAPVPMSTVVRYRSCALNIAEEIPEAKRFADDSRQRPSTATKRIKHATALRTSAEVSELLGISRQAVERVENAALRKLLRVTAAERAYRESEGQADRAGASLPGGMEDE
jgi:hypothetical protein